MWALQTEEFSHCHRPWCFLPVREYKQPLTCDLLLYCSTSDGTTLAVTMWLALLEALQAACSSLALGHTSLRSGSHRWCLQSATTQEGQSSTAVWNIPKWSQHTQQEVSATVLPFLQSTRSKKVKHKSDTHTKREEIFLIHWEAETWLLW